MFVGPGDDPFFIDLGAIFDGINIDKPGRPNIGPATRAAARTTSPATTRTVRAAGPGAQVTRDGKAVTDTTAANAVVGVWATTERKRMSVRTPQRPQARQGRLGAGLAGSATR